LVAYLICRKFRRQNPTGEKAVFPCVPTNEHVARAKSV
jgi:hypothetical protein